MGGLFEDLPPPSDASPGAASAEKPGSAVPARGGWSVGSRMAPPSLMQPRQPLKPAFAPTALRRAQAQAQAQAQSQTPKASVPSSSEQATPGVPSALDSPFPGAPAPAATPATLPSSVIQQDSVQSSSHGASVVGTPLAARNGAALVGASAALVDEYDPARPNDYEEILRERKRKRAEEERERERERQRREQEERERERERELLRQRDIQLAMQAEKERAAAAMAAAGAAAESSRAVSGEEAWRRRAMLSGMSRAPEEDRRGAGEAPAEGSRDRDAGEASPAPARHEESGGPPASGKPLTAAERMMMKMGWKAGQGLGKQEQGITTPLMARKTDKRAGVIVNAPEKKGGGGQNNNNSTNNNNNNNSQPQQPAQPQMQQQAPVQGSLPKGTPTKVVLLRNMVGPGEADGELEEEVAGECLKYGQVVRVLIFEATDPGFPPHEAVRIFICFDRVESAVKAAVDLDGRFFGGRPVRATYFSEERFAQQDLPPSQEELDQMDLQ